MDKEVACQHQIPHQDSNEKQQVEIINGIPIESGEFMHLANIVMRIQHHTKHTPMSITQLRH